MFRVNLCTGELCLTVNDFYLPGVFPINFEHSYRSLSQQETCFGIGWSHPFDIALLKTGNSLCLMEMGEESKRFDDVAAGSFHLDDDGFALDWLSSGQWAVTNKTAGLRYFFSESPNLSRLPVHAIADRNDNRLTFEHDSKGRITAFTDPFSRRLELRYEASRLRHVILTHHAGKAVELSLLECGYDESGNLAWTRKHSGATRYYEYDTGKLVAYTNELGGKCGAQYDATGMCVRTWEYEGNHSRQYGFDVQRGNTRVTDSFGNTTVYRFDENGMLSEVVNPVGGVTCYARDESGGLLAEIAPTGEAVEMYRYDPESRRSCRVEASGAETAEEESEDGRSMVMTDACGGKWEFEKDEHGKVVAYRTPNGHGTRVRRDDRGEITGIVYPDGSKIALTLSTDGLQRDAKDTEGVLYETTFDSLGRMLTYRAGGGPALQLAYHGLVEILTNVDGSQRQYEYDAMDNLIGVTDELDNEWRYRYDRYGRFVGSTDPLGFTTQYLYDAEGRIARVVNESGEVFENTYDCLGRITAQVGFDGVKREFRYDEAGRVVGRIDGDGRRLAVETDAVGLPIAFLDPTGHALEREFDPLGRLVASTDGGVSLARAFDAEGNCMLESDGENDVKIETAWHGSATRITSKTRDLRFTYGSRQRLESITENDELTITFAYDWENSLLRTRFDDGVCIEREFDARFRVIRQSVLSSDGAELVSESYRYDAGGNLVEKHRLRNGTLTFEHNARGELVSVRRDGKTLQQYAYDGRGNRVSDASSTCSYTRGNRLNESCQGVYQYDGEGRPTQRRLNDRSTHFAYDPLGRLSEVQLGADDKVGFAYDALFRRVEVTSSQGTRRTTWVGDRPFEEELPDGSKLKYIWHPISQRPIAIGLGDEWYCVVCDYRGEATELIRVGDEKIVWSSEPLGFHAEVGTADDTPAMPLRGLGQFHDDETGLLYQRARYYDAFEGRFVTPDPLGPIAGLNAYMFCGNQPFRYVDPLGLARCPQGTKEECDALFERIQQKQAELEKRWHESAHPKRILPWDGAPPVWVNRSAGQRGVYAAPHVAADGTPIPAGSTSYGSVESHIDQYEDVQRGMNKDIQEYYCKNCPRHEDKQRGQAMAQSAEWSMKKLHLPAYPPPPPRLAGRVTR